MEAIREVGKPTAGIIFVLGWAIGITLWSVAHLAPDATTGGFVVDIGILFVSVGFAAPFIKSQNWLFGTIMLAFVALALFAFGGYLHIPVIVYTLRLLVPLLALLTPLYRLLDFRIFA